MNRQQYADISAFQGVINWNAYATWAAQWSGHSLVAIKATEGVGFTDSRYEANRAGALAAGIDAIIFYHYARPGLGNTPEEEADWLFKVVGAIRPADSIMLDYEENTLLATAAWADKWLYRVEAYYGGKLPVIYASPSFIKAHLQDTRLALYPLVLANWTLDPAARPPCPPPWTAYRYVQYTDKASGIPGIAGAVDMNISLEGGETPAGGQDMVLPTTAGGENAVFVDNVTQFEGGETEEACVEFTFSNIWHSVQPGQSNQYVYEDIDRMADGWYVHFFGNISAQNGTSDVQLYEMFNSVHMKPEILPITFNGAENDERVRSALRAGKLVAICAAEGSFFDLEIGRPPYSWNTKPYNHAIVATGLITSGPSAGNVWVRDTAAVSGGYPPSTKRPYDIGKMQYVSLTAISPSWLTTGGGTTTMSGLPIGAKDNGKDTITFSNGFTMVKGFRAKYLEMAAAGLIPADDTALENEHGADPVEESNPAFWGGAGTAQVTRYFRLGYSAKVGVNVTYLGQEFLWYAKALDALRALGKTVPPVLPPLPAGLSAEQKAAIVQIEELLKKTFGG